MPPQCRLQIHLKEIFHRSKYTTQISASPILKSSSILAAWEFWQLRSLRSMSKDVCWAISLIYWETHQIQLWGDVVYSILNPPLWLPDNWNSKWLFGIFRLSESRRHPFTEYKLHAYQRHICGRSCCNFRQSCRNLALQHLPQPGWNLELHQHHSLTHA